MNYVEHPHEILFTGQLRRFVLRHVLKHSDLTDNIKSLGTLTQVNTHKYSCACPWCGAKEGFTLNKKTGDCFCSSCNKLSDLVDLMQESLNVSMSRIIGRFIYILEQGGEI